MQIKIITLIQLLYFFLPVFIANMMPVIIKNLFKVLAIPMDFNFKFRNKRIFGSHKTWRGLIFGTLAGLFIFAIQKYVYIPELSLINYNNYPLYLGALMGFGALTGDAIESFFKRQLDIKPGNPFIPFDQIDYTIGALIFMSPVYFPGWINSLILIIFSFIMHITVNHIAFYLKIRKVKW